MPSSVWLGITSLERKPAAPTPPSTSNVRARVEGRHCACASGRLRSLVPQFLLLSEFSCGTACVEKRDLPSSLSPHFSSFSIFCFPTLSSPLHPSSPSLLLSLLCAGSRVPHMLSIHYYHNYFPSLPPPLQVPFICQRLSWMSLACIKCDLPGTGPVTCVCCGLTVASQYPPACVVPEPAGSPSTFPCCPLSLCGLCSRDRGRSCGPEASSLRI